MSKEAMKLALEALEKADSRDGYLSYITEIEALREALAPQPAQQDIEELTAQRDKLADILTRTANALKGEPAELTQHSWHDLPEVAQQLKPAPVQQEPTKAMIDAAERIDWSDSDVRGNIVNMWQAMCAVAPQPAPVQQVAVGEAGTMPGTSGFTMACFKATDVPVGTKLYTSPPAQRKPLPYNKEDMKGLDINQRLAFKLGWKSAEDAHNIKEQP